MRCNINKCTNYLPALEIEIITPHILYFYILYH
jgi:hypothetical protein